MFGADAPPAPWDPDQRYSTATIEVYYLSWAGQPLTAEELAQALMGKWPQGKDADEVKRYGDKAVQAVRVNPKHSIRETCLRMGHVVPGIPTFFVVAKGTPYRDKFLESL